MARKRTSFAQAPAPNGANASYRALCDIRMGDVTSADALIKRGEQLKLSPDDAAALMAQGAVVLA